MTTKSIAYDTMKELKEDVKKLSSDNFQVIQIDTYSMTVIFTKNDL